MKLPLRPLFICACALLGLLAGCKESKDRAAITVTQPQWDSLVYPLQMQAYYVTVSSRKQAAQVSLRIDAYQNGKAVQRSGSAIHFLEKLHPIEISAAIYFDKDESRPSGTIVMALGKERSSIGRSSFKLNLPSLHDAGRMLYRFNSEINPDGSTPLFGIAYGAEYYSGSAPSPEYLIRDYKEQEGATVLIFSLETSQTIREFKPVAEQP